LAVFFLPPTVAFVFVISASHFATDLKIPQAEIVLGSPRNYSESRN